MALQAEIRLLGGGVDAIIQHTRVKPRDGWGRLICPAGGYEDPRLPVRPTDHDRLSRYEIAEALHPLYIDQQQHLLRRLIGEQLVQAWKQGIFRRPHRIGNLFLLPQRRVGRPLRVPA